MSRPQWLRSAADIAAAKQRASALNTITPATQTRRRAARRLAPAAAAAAAAAARRAAASRTCCPTSTRCVDCVRTAYTALMHVDCMCVDCRGGLWGCWALIRPLLIEPHLNPTTTT